MTIPGREVDIVRAKLGFDGGIIGASVLVCDALFTNKPKRT